MSAHGQLRKIAIEILERDALPQDLAAQLAEAVEEPPLRASTMHTQQCWDYAVRTTSLGRGAHCIVECADYTRSAADSAIELADTQALLDELEKRHEAGVTVLCRPIKNDVGSGIKMDWWGGPHNVVGLLRHGALSMDRILPNLTEGDDE